MLQAVVKQHLTYLPILFHVSKNGKGTHMVNLGKGIIFNHPFKDFTQH